MFVIVIDNNRSSLLAGGRCIRGIIDSRKSIEAEIEVEEEDGKRKEKELEVEKMVWM